MSSRGNYEDEALHHFAQYKCQLFKTRRKKIHGNMRHDGSRKIYTYVGLVDSHPLL